MMTAEEKDDLVRICTSALQRSGKLEPVRVQYLAEGAIQLLCLYLDHEQLKITNQPRVTDAPP